MAAFVVDPSAPSSAPLTGARLGIFPGGTSPSVFPASAPFWIGYGFVPESPARPDSGAALEAETRFELTIDGEDIELVTDLEDAHGRTVHKLAPLQGALVRRGQARRLERSIDRVRRALSTSSVSLSVLPRLWTWAASWRTEPSLERFLSERSDDPEQINERKDSTCISDIDARRHLRFPRSSRWLLSSASWSHRPLRRTSRALLETTCCAGRRRPTS
jgi:hypothetical protein